ncbi:Sca4 family spreading effector [Rickettsia endosymbiont of Cantharis rufa]|uniref:Sca4 family spreading effector n=1 Tax=Rickettsia endosymbiont of Cantharis rufa TaxID=3066248 RepID=UPI003132E127
MSKDGNPDISEFDPLNREFTEEEKQQQEKQKQELFSQTTPPELEADDSIFQAPASTSTSIPSISALSRGVSADGQTLDPITEAIRKEILEKQRDILREYFANTNPELAEQIAKEEEDKKFHTFLSNPDNQGLVNKAFEDSDTKKKLEAAEITGYKNVLSTYSAANGYLGGFKPVPWENQIGASDLRATLVKNDVGDELCTLNEKTVKTKPFTVAKQDGTQVQISSYREIDFPVKLDKADGSIHLSMVALKADGTKPSKDKAVYFTAHYEEGPNGKPLLKEISSPQPLKFAGDGPDAVAYIEHGGEIYTLAVTRGKYKEMMKEVELNQGQSVDLSQTISEDLTKVQNRSQETLQSTITPNQGLQSPAETPTTKTTQMLQPQQAKSSGIPNPPYPLGDPHGMPMPQQVNPNLLNAATALSGSIQDLLNYVNAGLTKETDNNKQIDLIKEAASAILNNEKSDIAEKQANIIALTENTVNTKDLTPYAKVTGVNAILETIKNDQNTPDLEKSKMLEGTVAIALNSENLNPTHKQQIVGKATELALTFNDELDRWAALNGLSDTIINSNLHDEQKGSMLIGMDNKINESKLTPKKKSQLIGDILAKEKEAGVLTQEQQQLMQQNLDKITAEQTKNVEIAEVQGILANPAFNAIAKTEAIQNVTTKVLDSTIKAEIKGETLENITKVVAESPLNGQDKADIVKGIGKAIASHQTIAPTEKIAAIEYVEKGVAESITDLEDKKLMTKGLVDGIYEGKATPEVTSELTKAVSSGIDKSTATPEDQKALKDAAMEAALEREPQNLNKDLYQDTDLHAAARKVANALKDVIDPILEAHPEKTEVSKKQITEKTSDIVAGITKTSKDVPTPGEEELEKSKESVVSTEEEVVKKTSGILSDISKLAVEKVNNFRAMLSPNGNLKTIEEKRVESEQQINKSITDYKTIDDKYKPQHEQQQGSYDNTKELAEKKSFIENLKLNDKEKIKLISTLIQNEADNKKKGAVNNITMLTENRTKLEEKVAIQDKSKVGYDAQLKPRKDTGRVP